MERALNLDLLGRALEEHPRIPSADQLRDLISQAEVQLFTVGNAPDEGLLRLGWYLYSVASADRELELFSPTRQLAAFEVAAHILDLCLRTRDDLSPADRLRMTFAAQCAYIHAGQTPNAIALGRRAPTLDQGPLDDPGGSSLQTAVALLSSDRPRVFDLTGRARDAANSLVELLEVETLTQTVYGPASHVSMACREVILYVTYGPGRGDLSQASRILRAVLDSPGPSTDLDSRWVATQLLPLLEGLGGSSIWAALPPDSPPDPARAMTSSNPPVLFLWPPQKDLFSSEPHPLDLSTKRVLLSLPTSGGKSLVSQLIVLSHLTSGTGGVCFVVPTRSLEREIRSDLRKRIRALPVDLAPVAGTWEELTGVHDVEVMTPERLAQLVRSDLSQTLERFGLFVIDEAHLLDDASRGWGLEATLTLLNAATLETHHRIVLLSSAVGNRTELMTWIDPSGEGQLFHDDWRGPRRLHGVYTTGIDWNSRAYEPPQRRQRLGRARYSLEGRVHLLTGGGRYYMDRFSESVGTATRMVHPSTGERSTIEGSETTAQRTRVVPLILRLAAHGPTLVIESQKGRAKDLALEVANEMEDAGTRLEALAGDCAIRLSPDHPLVAMIRRGVAFHHAGLPTDVQGLIEDAVREGLLQVVVTTTTLTEGVNLPVRSVVIASQGGEYADPYIIGAKLHNAIGRAGRATKETAGWVILVKHEAFTTGHFRVFRRRDEDLTVTSALTKPLELELLAQIDASIAQNADKIFEIAGSVAADFVSFVWHVARLTENADLDPQLETVMSVVRRTLAWQEMDDSHRRSLARITRVTFDRYTNTPVDLRHRWAASTVSIGSARAINQAADSLAQWLQNHPLEETEGALDSFEALTRSGVLDALLNLPEAAEVERRTPKIRGSRIEVDVSGLARDWLLGIGLQDLASTHFSAIADSTNRAEAMVEYVTALLEKHLPWVLAHLIPWVNEALAAVGDSRAFCPDLGLYIQWGVGSTVGIALMRGGVRSRRVVTAIEYEARQQGVEEEDLRSWLGGKPVRELRDLFELNRAEFQDIAGFARIETGSALRELLSGRVWSCEVNAAAAPVSAIPIEIHEDAERFGLELVHMETGRLVGSVPTPAIDDVRAVLDSGLPIAAELTQAEDPFNSDAPRLLQITHLEAI